MVEDEENGDYEGIAEVSSPTEYPLNNDLK
jgi:hypothetical protein